MSDLNKSKLGKLFNSGEYKEAIGLLEDFTENNPDDGEALAMLGFAYGHIPPEAIGEKDKAFWLDKSIETYERAVEVEPESIDYLRGLGRVLWHRARVSEGSANQDFLAKSLDVLERAYEMAEDNPDILSFIINVKIDMGDIDGAKEDLKKIASEKDSPYGAYLNAAFRFDEAGENELASNYAQKALDIAEEEGRADIAKKRLKEIAESE